MKLKSIELSWFRGAGSSVTLDTGRKSVVIYGSNGSGKSSFADALEYIVANGKITHLSHEYSGPRQRDGIRNTHAPDDQPSIIKISCEEGRLLTGTITPTGRFTIQSDPPDTKDIFQCFDLERFILRQDEVAKFIHATKGEKYSVLLPLLGLEEMEQAADNFNILIKSIENRSSLKQKNQKLEDLQTEILKYLPDLAADTVTKAINKLVAKYLDIKPPSDSSILLDSVQEAVAARVNQAEPEQARYLLFTQIADFDLNGKLTKLDEMEQQAAEAIGVLLDRQIAVLESTDEYVQNIDTEKEIVECPACGREIDTKEFRIHVQTELVSLTAVRSARDELIKLRKDVINSISQLLQRIENPALVSWLGDPAQKDVNEALSEISEIDLGDERISWDTQIWARLQKYIPIIHSVFSDVAKSIPPSTQDLIQDSQLIGACHKIPEILELEREISQVEQINSLLEEAESKVRKVIKDKTKATIKQVSSEVQTLWEKLHPNEPIEAVQLYIPKDAEKAIDICLKFFGVDQPSPRLSLSEGHRNSLGLCIFIALVKLGDDLDRPIILDDVVSSMDREHRGMLANILLEDLSDRQVIVLTHDREWYSELRARLPAKQWNFMALKPWQDPELGIQWSQSKDTFDDARILISINPTAAGNRARAIMDTQMALAAEKLFVPVLFARGDRNDHRTCIEFIERIMSMAKNALRRKQGDGWSVYDDPIIDWKEARSLLVSWGNRASHTGTLTGTEAEELIQVCEKALFHLRCGDCNDPIWIADQKSRKRLQCSCGTLQWKYG
ncbi:AAA family ATPase [Chloroflexota bacterium]